MLNISESPSIEQAPPSPPPASLLHHIRAGNPYMYLWSSKKRPKRPALLARWGNPQHWKALSSNNMGLTIHCDGNKTKSLTIEIKYKGRINRKRARDRARAFGAFQIVMRLKRLQVEEFPVKMEGSGNGGEVSCYFCQYYSNWFLRDT